MSKLDNISYHKRSKGLGKKGISIMIGYILLVGMAITLSVVVFNWLMHYVPDSDPTENECPAGINLLITDVICDSASTQLDFTIKNNGLFAVDGYSIGVNDKDGSTLGVYVIEESGSRINVSSEKEFSYNYRDHVDGLLDPVFESNLRLLEVRPFINTEEGPQLCSSVKEVLNCNIRPEVCVGGLDEDKDGYTDCEDSECIFNPSCAAEDSRLKLYLTFDSPTSPLKDYSSEGNDAVGMGPNLNYSTVTGYDGRGAYNLYNNASIILLDDANADALNDVFTLSALIRPGVNGNANARIFSRGCGSHFCMRIDQHIYFPQRLDFVADQSNRELDYTDALSNRRRWYHIVGVWNKVHNTARYYINGKLVTQMDYDLDFVEGVDRPIVFGSDVGPGNRIPLTTDRTYRGWVDEIRIYNRVLNFMEVEELFNYYNETGCGFDIDCPL